ncbi:hypothetical protein L1987_46189 [Smallanthus sonchifolius]|uniref:Uncharacterized protein n=1 Tax=Smallanthus sonchifolius TaxID=185202 RepID=A0ACB9FYW5_9ASTR|nr:hypothetical protein L1987_46189 [Smallanthus sonchifolius]
MDFLTRFPDVSGAPNIESLIVSGCTKLVEVDESRAFLKGLVRLDMSGCENLKCLPPRIELKFLEILILSYCESLESFPELSENHSWQQIRDQDFPKNLHGFSSLEELCLSSNSKLIQLPASISHLSGLKHLDLNHCRRIQNLQSEIQVVKASNCISLEMIEDVSQEYEWMHKIWLFGCQKLLKDEDNERYLDNILRNLSSRWDDHYLSYRKLSLADILNTIGGPAVRCGAQVVYKEDVESIKNVKPYISSYWNWKLGLKIPSGVSDAFKK